MYLIHFISLRHAERSEASRKHYEILIRDEPSSTRRFTQDDDYHLPSCLNYIVLQLLIERIGVKEVFYIYVHTVTPAVLRV